MDDHRTGRGWDRWAAVVLFAAAMAWMEAATVLMLLALYAFMADAIAALPRGADAMRSVLPVSFHWPLFAAGLVLIAVPLADMAGQIRRARRVKKEAETALAVNPKPAAAKKDFKRHLLF
jgi:hypothetical protein